MDEESMLTGREGNEGDARTRGCYSTGESLGYSSGWEKEEKGRRARDPTQGKVEAGATVTFQRARRIGTRRNACKRLTSDRSCGGRTKGLRAELLVVHYHGGRPYGRHRRGRLLCAEHRSSVARPVTSQVMYRHLWCTAKQSQPEMSSQYYPHWREEPRPSCNSSSSSYPPASARAGCVPAALPASPSLLD